jgi:uncharacterized protein
MKLTPAAARRFLIARHGVHRSLSTLEEAFARIGCVQVDPLAVTGMRNHDLVLAARVAGYRPAMLDAELYGRKRSLIEVYNKSLCIVPVEDLPYHRSDWVRVMDRIGDAYRAAAKKYGPRILKRLDEEGPLPSRELAREGKRVVAGWGSATEARHALYVLFRTGRIATVRREGNVRVFDRMERLVPARVLQKRVSDEDSIRHRVLSRFTAMGLLGTSGTAEVWVATAKARERLRIIEGLVDERVLRRVQIGEHTRYMLTRDERYLDEKLTGASMLAPLDPLIWDRRFTAALFGFEYKWQVYTPKHKRVGGYYDLPLLANDRFVGKIEPRMVDGELTIARIEGARSPAIGVAIAAHRDAIASRDALALSR